MSYDDEDDDVDEDLIERSQAVFDRQASAQERIYKF